MKGMHPNIAIVGSGYWGKNLVRNYHQLGALKLICDKNEEVLSAFTQQYPEVETCLAFSEVLHREDIDAVVIATPAETHYDLAREALLAEKHVYTEKPLVLREAEGMELCELARERSRILMVGHLLQYHPVFIHLKELVTAGELGRINYIYSHRLNLGKIRREENILWSFAPHDISMILELAGEAPEKILATGGCYLHKQIADVTTTHLEFPSGLQAHIFVSWLHPFKVQQLVVGGDQKMAVFDDTMPWEDKLLLYPHQITWRNNMPVPVKAEPERPSIPEEEPLKQECLHFLECISTGRAPVTDGDEGVRVLRVLNAAQRSLDNRSCDISVDAPTTPELSHVTASAPVDSGEVLPFFAHPTVEIDEGAEVGAETRIWHFSHVLSGSRIGEGCNLGQNVVIGPDVCIGKQCRIQNNVSVYKGVTLEDGVFCGPSMVFTNIFNPRADVRKMDQVRPTLVKQGATLGANCTIVCGVTIGSYAFVGAGTVVTRNVPDYALVVGNPSRQIGWVSRHGERLQLPVEGEGEAECPVTGERYRLENGGIAVVEGNSSGS
jgi:UDP-2-acetamido-3-amino-2,3-dideoxy-glucuronate N-acetyltransferase